MPPLLPLHHHEHHRRRQLRWIVPLGALLLLGTVVTLTLQYWWSDQAVSDEFFRAHKTISHTGQLLEREYLIGGGVLLLLLGIAGTWAVRLTHRIVRPVHTLHVALDALVAGELGVRVALHPGDEFHEVGDALNRLADEFSGTLARVHALVDRLERTASRLAAAAGDASTEAELHALAREVDGALRFFRLEPRRTVREDGQ